MSHFQRFAINNDDRVSQWTRVSWSWLGRLSRVLSDQDLTPMSYSWGRAGMWLSESWRTGTDGSQTGE
jgi:hypothetical protein